MKSAAVRILVLLSASVCMISCAHAEVRAPFIPHAEDKPMQSYLAMNLPAERYQRLLQFVQTREGVHLKSRGEAHITVVSPVEYDTVLKRHISIQEINSIALAGNIEQNTYHEVCIGRGQALLQGAPEKTYFVVVQAEGLIDIRQQIARAFVAHGGHPQDFRPEVFYPHITLGFTARDLFFEDGVIKNDTSCITSVPF